MWEPRKPDIQLSAGHLFDFTRSHPHKPEWDDLSQSPGGAVHSRAIRDLDVHGTNLYQSARSAHTIKDTGRKRLRERENVSVEKHIACP